MNPKLTLVLVAASVALTAGCTFPSSRRVVPRNQAGVMQHVEVGTVTSVRDATIEGEKSNLGTFGGGMIGGAAASGVGSGVGGALARAGGAVVGAVAGQAVEEGATRKRAQTITVQLDNGQTVVVTQESRNGLFQDGDRVRIMHGAGGATVAMDVGR